MILSNMLDAIGAYNRKFPFLYKISPGSFPNPSFPPKQTTMPITINIIPKPINIFPILQNMQILLLLV